MRNPSSASHQIIDAFTMRAALGGRRPESIGEPGIAVAVVLPLPTGMPVVLFADMQTLNEGASATNAASIVVAAVMNRLRVLAPGLQLEQMRWIEIDSDGFVDELLPLAHDEGQALSHSGISVDWRPLLGEGVPPRSAAALLRVHGGAAALDQVRSLIAGAKRLAKVA